MKSIWACATLKGLSSSEQNGSGSVFVFISRGTGTANAQNIQPSSLFIVNTGES